MPEVIIPETILQDDQTIDPVALETEQRIQVQPIDDNTTLYFIHPELKED
jgi:hypothetical protein